MSISPRTISIPDAINLINDGNIASKSLKRFRVIMRDGFRCNSCGRMASLVQIEPSTISNKIKLIVHIKTKSGRKVSMTLDHIIPKSLGGSNTLDNLQSMCKICNKEKGNHIEEFKIMV